MCRHAISKWSSRPEQDIHIKKQGPINLPALAWHPRGIADSTAQWINNRQLWATFSFSNDHRLRITKNIASLNSNKICPSKCLALKTLVHGWDQHCPISQGSYLVIYKSVKAQNGQNKNILKYL